MITWRNRKIDPPPKDGTKILAWWKRTNIIDITSWEIPCRNGISFPDSASWRDCYSEGEPQMWSEMNTPEGE